MTTQDPYGRPQPSGAPTYTADETQVHPYQPGEPYQRPAEPLRTEQSFPTEESFRTEEHFRSEEQARSEARAAAARQEERFGGINWGAGFFGWLVAVATAVLITGLAGAAVTATGSTAEVIPSELDGDTGPSGLIAAAALVAILVFAYYTGGYVAGRMSRFVGGRQGVGVYVTGLVSTLVTVGVGVVFGSRYDLLGRVNLATIPIPTEAVGLEGAVTAVAALLGTLLAAILGGKVGCRYHRKVDSYGVDPAGY